MRKHVNINIAGQPEEYKFSLVPLVIQSLGYNIWWCSAPAADLRIVGPFFNLPSKKFRWLPKPIRPFASRLIERMPKKNNTLTLFQTGENVRHNFGACDFSISFDLGVTGNNHYRLPYWMEMVNWKHEGIEGNTNPRFGRLLELPQLQQPLGQRLLERPNRVAFFTSHLLEPRKSLYEVVKRQAQLDGYGPYFDKSIRSHNTSGLAKYDVLQNYRFNLCPENSLYPGYITEKIPEAYMAGTLPITWADTNLMCDFNPAAMVNLYPETFSGYQSLDVLRDHRFLKQYSEQPLLLRQPSIEPLKDFLKEVLAQATS